MSFLLGREPLCVSLSLLAIAAGVPGLKPAPDCDDSNRANTANQYWLASS
jgi:hypothetical protein